MKKSEGARLPATPVFRACAAPRAGSERKRTQGKSLWRGPISSVEPLSTTIVSTGLPSICGVRAERHLRSRAVSLKWGMTIAACGKVWGSASVMIAP